MVNEVATPAVMVATGVPIDFVASVVSAGQFARYEKCTKNYAGSAWCLRAPAGCNNTASSTTAAALQSNNFIRQKFERSELH
jgi:hypothetical protein